MTLQDDGKRPVHLDFDPSGCEVIITDDPRDYLDYPFVNVNFKYTTGQLGQINIPRENLSILRDAITEYLVGYEALMEHLKQ